MKQKTPILLLAILAVCVTGISFVALSNTEITYSSLSNPMWSTTHPSQLGTDNWIGSIGASYTTTDPYVLKELSDVIILGEIKNISQEIIHTDDNPNDGVIEPPMRIEKYQIGVTEIIKGDHDDDHIIVIIMIDTKIDYSVGDNVLVMVSDLNGKWTPVAGPHGMFKVVDDKIVGDEKTLNIKDIS